MPLLLGGGSRRPHPLVSRQGKARAHCESAPKASSCRLTGHVPARAAPQIKSGSPRRLCAVFMHGVNGDLDGLVVALRFGHLLDVVAGTDTTHSHFSPVTGQHQKSVQTSRALLEGKASGGESQWRG